AIGSSVPVCPALTRPISRRTLCRAAFEVSPAGLSSSRTPASRTWGTLFGIIMRMRAILGYSLVDELRQTDATLNRGIVDEFELGNGAKRESSREPRAQKASRVLQRRRNLFRIVLGRHRGHEHLGVRQIAGHIDCADGDQAHAGVLDL